MTFRAFIVASLGLVARGGLMGLGFFAVGVLLGLI